MALPTRPLTVTVCDGDPLVSRTFGQLAADRGFEVGTPATNGAQLLDMLAVVHPSLVIVTNELPGIPGIEVLANLARLAAPPELVLVTSDERVRADAMAAGAFAVADRYDLGELEAAVDAVKELFETGERRKVTDRRSGRDRRQEQDWSKVISERRVGERRQGPRRSDEQTADDGWVDRRKEQDWSKVTVERRQPLPQRRGS
jgi:DNA-binding NarL/FixJ family response regulator